MENKKIDDQFRIDFLIADIAMLKAQLETGWRIVPIIIPFQNHPTSPTTIGHKATTTYTKMNDLDEKVINEVLGNNKKELATLTVKIMVNNSKVKSDEKENKKSTKKD